MRQLRRSFERGHFDFGWLKTYHSFSFGEYFDPNHTQWGALRVINEDFVAPGEGFPTHGHRNMEIITYVLEGALEHKDSMGNGSIIKPGDIQYMSAGEGVRHSEFNAEKNMITHLLQIWILPNIEGDKPLYDQKFFSENQKKNKFCLLASEDGREGSIKIRQNAQVLASRLEPGKSLDWNSLKDRSVWIHVIEGNLELGEFRLEPGDAFGIANEDSKLILKSVGKETAHFLLFETP